MENDTIRGSGPNTLVDVWIDGKMRGVCVSRGAIEADLGFRPDQASAMTEKERCEFVRTHLAPIIKAAAARLRETDSASDTVLIDTAQLAPYAAGRGLDRRKTDRRKAERRKSDRPQAELPHPDRRRGERRKTTRRGRKDAKES